MASEVTTFPGERNIADSLKDILPELRIIDVELGTEGEHGAIPFALIPPGWKYENLESLLPEPQRPKGMATLHDTASFVAYVKRHASQDSALIWCNADYRNGKVAFTAIFNGWDVANLTPGWADWGCEYTPRTTVEWDEFFSKNKKQFSQAEFAEFVERNQRYFHGSYDDESFGIAPTPTGADMLQMALSLEVNKDMRVKSSIRLDNGDVELAFVEREDDTTAKKMVAFTRFDLAIAPFFLGPTYRVSAKLRYRVREGGVLVFWYELDRPDKVLEDACCGIVEEIRNGTSIEILFGEPE